MTQSTVEWTSPADSLPDDETTVLIVMDDGEPWTGFLEGGAWHYVTGDPITQGSVSYWAHFPAPPEVRA